VEDVVLAISPQDLSLLYLIYDCQHFCENIVTKSLNLVFKYRQGQPAKFLNFLARVFHSMGKCDLSKKDSLQASQAEDVQQRIKFMIEQKNQAKTLARLCNVKPKLFLNKCEEIYRYIEESAPWEVAAKILLYSREIKVEHVTEIVGGKEDRNIHIYSAFLNRQDFRDKNLELSLRRLMQTFRMAGVES
jgi:Sec7-like guanine-nucleotide exchange factor